MTDRDLTALDDAVRTYAATQTDDDTWVTGWVLVAAHSLDEDDGGAVTVSTAPGQPWYVDLGLLTAARSLIVRSDEVGDD